MQQISDAEGPGNPCQDCSYDNPPGEEFCQACNARIGAVRVGSKVDAEASSGRYRQIKAKVDEVRGGRITTAQFATYLEELSANLAHNARGIVGYFDAMNYASDNAEEVEMGLSGVEFFEQGLTELWNYSQDLEEAHLDSGLQMIWEGTQRILEAMRINRDSRASLAMYWDELRTD